MLAPGKKVGLDLAHLEGHGTDLEVIDKTSNTFLNLDEPFEFIFIISIRWILGIELVKLGLDLLLPQPRELIK